MFLHQQTSTSIMVCWVLPRSIPGRFVHYVKESAHEHLISKVTLPWITAQYVTVRKSYQALQDSHHKNLLTQHLQMTQIVPHKLFKLSWWEGDTKCITIISADTKEEVELFYNHLDRVKVKPITDSYIRIEKWKTGRLPYLSYHCTWPELLGSDQKWTMNYVRHWLLTFTLVWSIGRRYWSPTVLPTGCTRGFYTPILYLLSTTNWYFAV